MARSYKADLPKSHSIFMRTASYQRPMSVLLNWFKLVDGPFGQNIFRANNFCPDQPGRNRKYSRVHKSTLESGIDVGQGITVGPGKFVKRNKRRALNKRRA